MLEKIPKPLANKKTLPPGKERKRFLNKKIPREVLVNGFTKVPNAIILDPALSCQDFRILAVLNFHSKSKIECWPSHKTIRIEANCYLAGVKRSLKKLKELGYVSWTRTKSTNVYTLNFKKP